ncbi:unnamed protein product [Rotaria sp. Silwood2]|nr:unnamed protein product [Rotaria sp. Silwood2]CAF4466663.1 unnamed protein product [Rotaria sp. Silwood2]
MNNYRNYTFLNTLLELHGLKNIDKIFSIFHWTILTKKYLLKHEDGQYNEILKCRATNNDIDNMELEYAVEGNENNIHCSIKIDKENFNMTMSTMHHGFEVKLKKNKYFDINGSWNERMLIELINYFNSTIVNFRGEEKKNMDKIHERNCQQNVREQLAGEQSSNGPRTEQQHQQNVHTQATNQQPWHNLQLQQRQQNVREQLAGEQSSNGPRIEQQHQQNVHTQATNQQPWYNSQLQQRQQNVHRQQTNQQPWDNSQFQQQIQPYNRHRQQRHQSTDPYYQQQRQHQPSGFYYRQRRQ